MEINPLPGMSAFTAAQSPTDDFQLSALADIQAVARPDHSARLSPRKKSAVAEESDADNPPAEGESADGADDEPKSQISLFA
jgi:hypothetical protein